MTQEILDIREDPTIPVTTAALAEARPTMTLKVQEVTRKMQNYTSYRGREARNCQLSNRTRGSSSKRNEKLVLQCHLPENKRKDSNN